MKLTQNKIYISDLDIAIKHTIGIENLKGKKILITGAMGTIGSFVADMLFRYNQISDAKMIIYVAGRNIEKLKQRFSDFKDLEVLFYDMDRSIEFDIDIDYIVHAAGKAHPAAFVGDPVGTIMGNINSTYNLLEYGREHGADRLLYVSSGEVYGQGDLDREFFDESYAGYLNIQDSRFSYPSSKRATENLCASYSKQYGFETVVVRPCHTYGPEMTPSDNRANVQFIRNVLNEEDIIMKSAGNQMRSYNYVADCASALLTVMINGNSGEAYNLANPNAKCTIAELAKIIAEVAGRKVIFEEPDANDIANRTPIAKQLLSSKKIESMGWNGAYTLEDGMKHMVDILKNE